ncbi:hypothetical protein Tco_0369811 [Tanacetum coccineum]
MTGQPQAVFQRTWVTGCILTFGPARCGWFAVSAAGLSSPIMVIGVEGAFIDWRAVQLGLHSLVHGGRGCVGCLSCRSRCRLCLHQLYQAGGGCLAGAGGAPVMLVGQTVTLCWASAGSSSAVGRGWGAKPCLGARWRQGWGARGSCAEFVILCMGLVFSRGFGFLWPGCLGVWRELGGGFGDVDVLVGRGEARATEWAGYAASVGQGGRVWLGWGAWGSGGTGGGGVRSRRGRTSRWLGLVGECGDWGEARGV